MTEYHQRFLSLLDRQPPGLSYLEKCLRIDRLSCFEMDTEISVNPQRSCLWFWLLCTVLDYSYYKLLPAVATLPPFKQSILYACYFTDDEALDKLKPREFSDKLRAYIQVRREVIEEINELKTCTDSSL